ncbi:hypothetical protein M9Y10_044361 [Tritrichomonas musculus]|uniref:F5/8 type C domain-containing protein n=1 Tax=Tritrichomonas musculus TaxID=1915356 RepID=A0ABR2GNM0_9EUKA
MSEKSIILSSAGLKNIVEAQNEFTFVFNKCEIHMNSVFAEFISPLVSRLHHSDPTIDSIHYDNPLSKNLPSFEELFTEEMKTLLQQISKGFPISINSEQAVKMQQIAILLCNNELFNSIQDLCPHEINNNNFDEYISKLELFQYQSAIKYIGQDIDFTALIDVISSNFYQIDKNKLKSLSKPLLHKIISNKHLKIESEDSLFEFIDEIFEGTNEESQKSDKNELTIYDFYELIEFVGLSDEKFREFVTRFDPTQMTNPLWGTLCNRFLDKHSNDDRYSKPKGKMFLFNGNKSESFHGIIHHLTKECGGNVSDKGVVSVLSCPERSSDPGKNAVDFDTESNVITDNTINSFLVYDFKDKKVKPTNYSIRSRSTSKGDFQLKNWVIEGSNTGQNDWKILDTQNNETCLDDKSVFHTFDIKEKLSDNEYFRFLRIRLTGPNTCSRYTAYNLCL